MKIQTIGFYGFGLIGASIAIALKKADPSLRLWAIDCDPTAIDEGYRRDLLENNTNCTLADFGSLDLIFLCAPVEENIHFLPTLAPHLSSHTLLTDVGSTKAKIHEEVRLLGLSSCFIGGHPMTGSEKSGITNASSTLFENAYYLLTPTERVDDAAKEQISALVSSMGALPLVLSPDQHDYVTASVSHLPHMIAYSLVNLIREADDENEMMKRIAAGGFKDITRIASASPMLWSSICSTNRGPLMELLETYIKALTDLYEDLRLDNKKALLDKFQTAKDYRDSISISTQTSKNGIWELFLDLADEAGQIAVIASILAFRGISIKNIGIVHNREFEEGVLHVEFYDSSALELAAELLTEKNYHIYRR